MSEIIDAQENAIRTRQDLIDAYEKPTELLEEKTDEKDAYRELRQEVMPLWNT